MKRSFHELRSGAIIVMLAALSGLQCKKEEPQPAGPAHWFATEKLAISFMSPVCGVGGEPFIIHGAHFDETSRVYFGVHEAQVDRRTPSYITGIVPVAAYTGTDVTMDLHVTNHVEGDTVQFGMLADVPCGPVGPTTFQIPDSLPPIYQPDIEAFWVNAYDPQHQLFIEVDSSSITENGARGQFDVEEFHFDTCSYLQSNWSNGIGCFWHGGYMIFNLERSDGVHWIQCYLDTTSGPSGVTCDRWICRDNTACGKQFILGCP